MTALAEDQSGVACCWFGFVAKHRHIWPASWLRTALDVSRSGFHVRLGRARSERSRKEQAIGAKVWASFLAGARTDGARRVWRDVVAESLRCSLHCIEHLMLAQVLRARPRRLGLRKDEGPRQPATALNLLERAISSVRPKRKWIVDFAYDWTAAGRLYVVVVIEFFRRVVSFSMKAAMTTLQHGSQG